MEFATRKLSGYALHYAIAQARGWEPTFLPTGEVIGVVIPATQPEEDFGSWVVYAPGEKEYEAITGEKHPFNPRGTVDTDELYRRWLLKTAGEVIHMPPHLDIDYEALHDYREQQQIREYGYD